ncbi:MULTISPECIES: deoxyguanosinetriphosphate triphosphohydrolase [Thermobifida]|uniref:deoxyguanosinetriphosphate triphosphohydrolase n=1 Tax=Thermobifida TaxID=83677 RepID=UPI000CEDC853|nr:MULTISPECIES: deoxyguanosinetriphosphate triphosphohydrolase [Thermobifida]MBO2529243.1 deoxyguanosinetriphosphate triphosphohydrolase [Thermobifida sp.]PPS92703.1 deoxyguanosinetriphosphate triphosphohydrolase [Thermobifida fusca]
MAGNPGDGYRDHDRQRWAAEPPKRRSRSDFARDRARVLHSFALRRLAAKTQVAQPGVSDFPRTRLTHSLECAQIGRELSGTLGCDPDLVEAACLAHDLGHPPFGHNGEAALDRAARPCGGFESNAQSLRLLTRLEGKVFTPEGRSAGLNLTRATLDATLKYPWRRGEAGETAKFNVYAEDSDVFAWIRQGEVGRRTCLEAQVMDWADDVAYSVHDLEDGLYTGQLSLAALHSPAERSEVCRTAAAHYSDAEPAELEEVFARLMAQECWPRSLSGDLPSLAALKNLTSELIGRFCRAAERATLEKYGSAPLTRYAAELVVPREQRMECALLKAVTAHYVFLVDEEDRYARERQVVTELVEAVAAGAPATLEPQFQADYAAAQDDAAALRVVIDQVASLTDLSALSWHARLC